MLDSNRSVGRINEQCSRSPVLASSSVAFYGALAFLNVRAYILERLGRKQVVALLVQCLASDMRGSYDILYNTPQSCHSHSRFPSVYSQRKRVNKPTVRVLRSSLLYTSTKKTAHALDGLYSRTEMETLFQKIS